MRTNKKWRSRENNQIYEFIRCGKNSAQQWMNYVTEKTKETTRKKKQDERKQGIIIKWRGRCQDAKKKESGTDWNSQGQDGWTSENRRIVERAVDKWSTKVGQRRNEMRKQKHTRTNETEMQKYKINRRTSANMTRGTHGQGIILKWTWRGTISRKKA